MDYAHPELLAETGWLAEHIGDRDLLVVDCDEYPAYQRLHIEGAIGLRVHHYLKEAGDSASGPGIGMAIMPPDQFAKTMASHGISNKTLVVAYDNLGGLYASRLWWSLDYYGHPLCKVLNGGFRKWYEEGRPVTMDAPHVDRGSFEVTQVRDEVCATKQSVTDAIGSANTVVWDVRAQDEHSGTDARPNKRHGHVPGARNLEWLDLTVKPPVRSGLFLPADQIAEKLAAAGITPDKRVITHCQAGIRAAHSAFVLRLMGYPDVRNYDASWSEWGNVDDTAITTD